MFNGGIGNWHYGWRRRDACRRGHGGENGETRGQERGPEGELIDLQFIGQVFRGIIGVWTAFGGPRKKLLPLNFFRSFLQLNHPVRLLSSLL